MSSRGRLYLHIGLAKTGTTFLQALLAENRPRLREAGFIYPFVRPEGMFHAAVEVRGEHARWGLDAEHIDGTWQALLDKADAFDGTAIISHEILAGASREQVEGLAGSLEGFDLQLVVTVRDLARQVPAHWQEAVKNGESFSFAKFSREVARSAHAPESRFWEEQDLVDVLDRWSSLVAPERVNLVLCPPRGAGPELLWGRFAAAVGIQEGIVDPITRRTNQSLGTAQVRLLRDVNQALAGRIGQPAYAHIVKRFFAQRLLAASLPSHQALAPVELRESLERLADSWTEQITAGGYRVHGDLADLAPTEFAEDGSTPDDVTDAEVAALTPAVVGQLLARLAEPAEPEAPEPQPSSKILRKFRTYRS